MFSLSGKIALVTGGCSGIGLAIVARFMAAGAQVIAADLTTTPAFNKIGASFVALDVTDEDRLTQVFEEVEANFGKLDILVNNAGIGLEEGPLIEADIDAFQKTLAVNLNGVLFGLKYGPRHMNDGGSIVNTASLAATMTMPEYTGYSVSKAGVVKLSQQAAVELSDRNIRVNAVCPGTTTTPMEPADSEESRLCQYLTAAGRPGTPEEQAAVFHFLASDDASYVNAQAISVDGGWVHGLNNALIDKLLA
ncbi:SDR family oxidoreductase [Luminiphilus sp.]|nr:SDR family oxidoreductase [Luminiphilus sp.]